MNVTIINASMRENSQSLKIANWLVKHANQMKIEAELLDLQVLSLPMFDDRDYSSNAKVKMFLDQLNKSDGFVFVSPEWNGMMSQGLINMMHFVKTELAHKPVMLAGVSSGRGGHYPLIEMRIMGYKNKHYVVIPENLLVQECTAMLNDHDMSIDAPDIMVKKRASYGLRVLKEYANALSGVRSSGVVDLAAFPNGV
jgi:multimeric flavodoxin WrbA